MNNFQVLLLNMKIALRLRVELHQHVQIRYRNLMKESSFDFAQRKVIATTR